MKYLTFTFLVLLESITCTAKIWRVNNNQIDADFSTIAEAIEAANPGDTLYIEGSTTSYAGATIDKPLILIGAGYFLEENYSGEAYFNNLQSFISSLQIEAGAEGSVFIGMEIGSVNLRVGEIQILRNYIRQGINIQARNTDPFLDDIIINGNYIERRNPQASIHIQANVENLQITNNYLLEGIAIARLPGGDRFYNSSVVQVRNNIFRQQYDNTQYNNPAGAIDIDNATIENNILLTGPINGSNNNLLNNLSSEDIGSAQGNTSNVDMATVFVVDPAEPISEAISPDGRWQLAENSPAIGVGTSDENAGMYGGDSPYVLSGLPPIPFIYEITSVANTTVEAGLPVQIKIRVNN